MKKVLLNVLTLAFFIPSSSFLYVEEQKTPSDTLKWFSERRKVAMTSIFIMLTTLWLTGCATLSYQEPTQGPRARVRFVTISSETNQITILFTYDDTNCTNNEKEWMRLKAGYLLNSHPKTLGMPLWNYNENSAKEVFVEANKQINAMFIERGGYSCGTPFSFSFLENQDYEVRFQSNLSDPTIRGFLQAGVNVSSLLHCQTTISQIIRNGDGWSLKEIAIFDNKTNNNNRGCYEKLNKLRLY